MLKQNLHIKLITAFCISLIPVKGVAQHSSATDIANKSAVILLSPLTSTNTGHPIVILNAKGDTLLKKHSDVMICDFARWKYNDKTRYTYFLEDTTFHKMTGANRHSGYQVITDTSFNEIKRVTLLSHGIVDAEKQKGVDNHDFILLADDHYIALAYYEHSPGNIPAHIPLGEVKTVVTPVIQEVHKNKVVWQWVGSNYPELYTHSFVTNDSEDIVLDPDFLHVNSIFLDTTDDNLIISCRNSNQIMKLDRKNGGILWKLGGYNSDFEVSRFMSFLRQHHVTKCDSNTLIFIDNGNRDKRNYSRIIEFVIDEQNKKILSAKQTPVRTKFIEFGGSVQKLGNTYFINGGSGNFMTELDIKRKKTLSLQLIPGGAYRAIKYFE